MAVPEIFNRFIEKYAACDSYQDSGTVSRHGEFVSRSTDFTTYFSKPRLLRYDWREVNPERKDRHPLDMYTLLVADSRSLVLNSAGLHEDKLPFAILGIYSHACIVPTVLIPRLQIRDGNLPNLYPSYTPQSSSISEVKELKLAKQEQSDGLECAVLQGSWFKPDDTTIWISSNDFTLRRLKVQTGSSVGDVLHARELLEARESHLSDALGRTEMPTHTQIEAKDHRFEIEYRYTTVNFDQTIADSVFSVDSLEQRAQAIQSLPKEILARGTAEDVKEMKLRIINSVRQKYGQNAAVSVYPDVTRLSLFADVSLEMTSEHREFRIRAIADRPTQDMAQLNEAIVQFFSTIVQPISDTTGGASAHVFQFPAEPKF